MKNNIFNCAKSRFGIISFWGLFLLPLFALLSGCNKEESIPAYLKIEPFVVTAEGGTKWQKITEGWVYANGNLLGAYTLPATVPLLVSGETAIEVLPGVKENGILATPSVYSLMKSYKVTKVMAPAETTTIQPSTDYKSDIFFPWASERGTLDGSSTLIFENRDVDIVTGFELVTDGAYEGRSLKMAVDTGHTLIEIGVEPAALPTTGERQVWLELHHKNDIPFELYLVGVKNGVEVTPKPVFQFNSTESEWGKIYINLTAFVAESQAPEKQKISFRVKLPQDNTGAYTALKGNVWLDNIRLIHF